MKNRTIIAVRGVANQGKSASIKIVYSLLNYPRSGASTDVVWRKRFMIGHAIHRMLQDEFAKMGIGVSKPSLDLPALMRFRILSRSLMFFRAARNSPRFRPSLMK